MLHLRTQDAAIVQVPFEHMRKCGTIEDCLADCLNLHADDVAARLLGEESRIREIPLENFSFGCVRDVAVACSCKTPSELARFVEHLSWCRLRDVLLAARYLQNEDLMEACVIRIAGKLRDEPLESLSQLLRCADIRSGETLRRSKRQRKRKVIYST